MKHKKIIVTLLAASIISGCIYGIYRLGMKQAMKAAAPMPDSAHSSVESGQGDGSSGKRVLYWHDPMVPGQKFDKPGKSPFMDMQLVPVYADADNERDDGKISISPRVQQNLGIRTVEVIKENLTPLLAAVGNVSYNERDVALVQARSNGFVERLFVRAPLDPVRKGQALAELYVPEWIATQEEYLSVRRMRGDAALGGLVDAARQRMRLAGMTDSQIRLIESSGKVHPRLTIIAPIGGVVAELAVREGMTVMAGAPLFRINSLRTVWINADVPENISAQVRPGNAVEVRTPSLPGMAFKGKVGALLPDVNAVTRTFKARIELANPSGRLVPGMFATLNFSSKSLNDVLMVPSEAVIQTGQRSVVMLAQGNGKFIPIDVEVGAEANGRTEIRKGLEAGQKVVVSGQFLIDSEASLKGTMTRMSDASAPQDRQAAGPAHRGEGRVEHVGKEGITISHGPIPSLQWGAMTMDFKLPASGLPKKLAAGDRVVFEFRPAGEGVFEITDISPVAAPMQHKKGKAIDGTMKKEMHGHMTPHQHGVMQ
jgi:Cu(I)/Ag(I) efflux system membrane fusion protein